MKFALFNSPIFNYQFLGNTLQNLIIATVSFPVFLGLFRLVQKALTSKFRSMARRTKTDIDDAAIEIIDSLKPPFYFFLSFYLSLRFLLLSEILRKVVNAVLIIWVVYQLVIAAQIILNYIIKKIEGKEDPGARQALSFIKRLIKYSLWTLGALLILSNLGVNISSLVAGLGIGGIAVALAIQNILGDLFSSFAIYFDKPFVIGDFIVLGEHMGTVEKIGIKTTRLRSLQGEEIVLSNRKITNSDIKNFKKMKERRVLFTLAVTYETETEKMKQIPRIVKKIIESVPQARFARCHFKEFGEFSLNFEVVYYVETNDYEKYMDINQEIHLKIKQEFEKENIEFAYPTQTFYLKNLPSPKT